MLFKKWRFRNIFKVPYINPHEDIDGIVGKKLSDWMKVLEENRKRTQALHAMPRSSLSSSSYELSLAISTEAIVRVDRLNESLKKKIRRMAMIAKKCGFEKNPQVVGILSSTIEL